MTSPDSSRPSSLHRACTHPRCHVPLSWTIGQRTILQLLFQLLTVHSCPLSGEQPSTEGGHLTQGRGALPPGGAPSERSGRDEALRGWLLCCKVGSQSQDFSLLGSFVGFTPSFTGFSRSVRLYKSFHKSSEALFLGNLRHHLL